jgi:hypothetical protein
MSAHAMRAHAMVRAVQKEEQERKFEELRVASQPLIDFMRKYYDPMTYAIVTEGHTQILSSVLGTPLLVED